jgi:hypothetical protein
MFESVSVKTPSPAETTSKKTAETPAKPRRRGALRIMTSYSHPLRGIDLTFRC